MKTCPSCHSVYTYETAFCLNDGTRLVVEIHPKDEILDDEPETVLRSQPNDGFFSRSYILQPLIKGKLLLILVTIGGVFILGFTVFWIFNGSRSSEVSTSVKSSGRHNALNTTRKDSEFNGLVNTENANLRSSPNSTVSDILPKGDRLDISDRENAASPWYRVVCEHGLAGWMHGNTIKFTANSTRF